ncbi:MAG: anthranilate synthase component I family protein [Phycisphaeraceae bacterium]|nr:anthranilate synthase component I family protein [Phycisphaerales bacterium]MCB9860082.1 anthranilate synthase component I family protein [Phycisphaeraceae bacterium]
MLNQLANTTTQQPFALVCSANDDTMRTQLGIVEWTFRIDQGIQDQLTARWIDARTGESIDTTLEQNNASSALDMFRDLANAVPTRSDSQSTDTWAWIGWISYEFGELLEPKASVVPIHRRRNRKGNWPLIEFHRVRLIDDADILSRYDKENQLLQLAPAHDAMRREFLLNVQRIRNYIRAGDIYQANLTTEIQGTFTGNSRHLFAHLAQRSQPWYGVYAEGSRCKIDTHQRALLSFSPELFLKYDATSRTITTRPMKGTRSGTTDAARDDLLRSDKDKAELAMIVDLMRNDLSRVCEVGSVRVPQPREIEQHNSGVWQATTTVQGTLNTQHDIFDTIAATFPGGSVTGAPKIRAMQIIEEIEQRERGPYCGCAGIIHDDGSAELNLSIRTLTLEQETVRESPFSFENARAIYPVGSGVVYRSEPGIEWHETFAKATWLYEQGTQEDEADSSSSHSAARM